MINILTDLAAYLTQVVLLSSEQRLLKPFFDIWKNQGEATSQSYFIEAVYLLTLARWGKIYILAKNSHVKNTNFSQNSRF